MSIKSNEAVFDLEASVTDGLLRWKFGIIPLELKGNDQ